MRVYGYVRLSRDEDKEQNSLNNQKQILIDYAEKNGYEIVEIFEDDNVSGMTFDREGLNQLKELTRDGQVDIVLVKDLSRLGRHKAHSALFLELLKSQNVKVISVTENIDNFNENDDLLIGFKQIINDSYAKDISKKVRAGFKQKQKSEGLVIIPPFGYIKNQNKEIEINPECAEIVKLIFKLYLEGYGGNKISRILLEKGYHTPSWYQKQINGKTYHASKTWMAKEIWSDRTVLRIIENEAYMGTLRCGTTSRSLIYKYKKELPKEEHFIHENFFPPIIDKETYEMAQAIRKNRNSNNIRANKNSKIHRYAGLLMCKECGATFVAKRRKGKEEYVEYVCNGYHRFGNKVCTPHRIKESELDDLLYAFLSRLKDVAQENLERVDQFIKEWNYKKKEYTQSIDKIQMQIFDLKEDIKSFARQNARGVLKDELFSQLTKESEDKIALLEEQIETLNNVKDLNKEARFSILNSLNMLDEVLKNREISNAQIQLLVNRIHITEDADENVSMELVLNMPFKHHLTLHDVFTEASSSCVNAMSVIEAINEFMKHYIDKKVSK